MDRFQYHEIVGNFLERLLGKLGDWFEPAALSHLLEIDPFWFWRSSVKLFQMSEIWCVSVTNELQDQRNF